MNPVGFFVIFAGLFSTAGGILNWEWFMNNRKARFISKILTRKGARIFYVVLGIAMVIFGILLTMGFVQTADI